MVNIRTLLLAGAVSGLGLAGSVGAANASPFNTTFGLTIYNFGCPNCQINSPSQQALASNPEITGTPLYTGTYMGAMDFNATADTIGSFFTSGGGTSTPNLNSNTTTLSTGTYGSGATQTTTLMKFSFTIGHSMEAIIHDDGISLYISGQTADSQDLLPIADSAPTSAATADITLVAGAYDLYYVEGNGLPAVLTFDTTAIPEPASLALLGLGLVGLGVARRRKAPRA